MSIWWNLRTYLIGIRSNKKNYLLIKYIRFYPTIGLEAHLVQMDNFLRDSAGTRQELDDTNMAVSSVDSQKDNNQLNTSTSSSQPRTTITASVTAILHSAANLMQSSAAGTLLGLRTRSSDASAHEEVVVQGSSKSDAQLTNKRSRSTTSEKK